MPSRPSRALSWNYYYSLDKYHSFSTDQSMVINMSGAAASYDDAEDPTLERNQTVEESIVVVAHDHDHHHRHRHHHHHHVRHSDQEQQSCMTRTVASTKAPTSFQSPSPTIRHFIITSMSKSLRRRSLSSIGNSSSRTANTPVITTTSTTFASPRKQQPQQQQQKQQLRRPRSMGYYNVGSFEDDMRDITLSSSVLRHDQSISDECFTPTCGPLNHTNLTTNNNSNNINNNIKTHTESTSFRIEPTSSNERNRLSLMNIPLPPLMDDEMDYIRKYPNERITANEYKSNKHDKKNKEGTSKQSLLQLKIPTNVNDTLSVIVVEL